MTKKTTTPETGIKNAIERTSEENREPLRAYLEGRSDLSPQRKERIAKAIALVDRFHEGRPLSSIKGEEYRAWLDLYGGQTRKENGRYLRGFLRWLDSPDNPNRGRLPEGFGSLLLEGKGGQPTAGWRRHRLERVQRDASDERTIRNLIDGCSPRNRLDFDAFFRSRRRKAKVAQIKKYARVLSDLDRHTNGTHWKEWTDTQLRDWTDAMLRRVKPGTSQQYALIPWAFLRHQYRMMDRFPPNAIKDALDVGANHDEKKPRRIPDEHFFKLLGRHKADLMYQALLWVLWATGFRIGEALSLNVGNVRREPDPKLGDGVFLAMPPKAECRFRTKGRSREVWVQECLTALNDWLAIHPFPDRMDAPLFLRRSNQSDDADWLPFSPDVAQRTIRQDCIHLGITPITDHDFRHNRAFRFKVANVPKEKANVFLGWEPGSNRYETYGRLVAADIREDVRRASGNNGLGQVVVHEASQAEQKLKQLQDLLGGILDDRTRRQPQPPTGGER